MQLTYRGRVYDTPSASYPIITAEQELSTTYRGVQTTKEHYQFQASNFNVVLMLSH